MYSTDILSGMVRRTKLFWEFKNGPSPYLSVKDKKYKRIHNERSISVQHV
jgi:hypothetical protein